MNRIDSGEIVSGKLREGKGQTALNIGPTVITLKGPVTSKSRLNRFDLPEKV